MTIKPAEQRSSSRTAAIYRAVLSFLCVHCWSEPAGRVNTPPRGGRSFDSLERRELLSYTVVVDGDQLQITGTDGRECIYITERPAGLDVRPFCRGEKNRSEFIPGKFSEITIDLRGGKDKLVMKNVTAPEVDAATGDGNDRFRYYDFRGLDFCADLGAGNDVLKARRNDIVDWMADGGSGIDLLIKWGDTNNFGTEDISGFERQGVFRNGRVHD